MDLTIPTHEVRRGVTRSAWNLASTAATGLVGYELGKYTVGNPETDDFNADSSLGGYTSQTMQDMKMYVRFVVAGWFWDKRMGNRYEHFFPPKVVPSLRADLFHHVVGELDRKQKSKEENVQALVEIRTSVVNKASAIL